MSNYNISSVEELPSNLVASFNPLIIINKVIPDVNEISKNFNNTSWIENAVEEGRDGEKIALSYLKTIYSKAIDTSGNNSLGYDIWADNQIFEVKTTKKNSNTFEITITELKAALLYKQQSNLFFIKIKNKIATGYIINDIFNSLKLEWETVLSSYENENVIFSTTKIRITLSDEFIAKLKEIDLTSHYKKLTQQKEENQF